MVAQLLTLMDGLKGMDGVVVVATTNRINKVDPALRRPGRFAREIHVPPPDEEGRLEILRIHVGRMPLAPATTALLPSIAERTHGFVGADLMGLCFESGMNALRRCSDLVGAATSPGSWGRSLANLAIEPQDFELALEKASPSALRETYFAKPTTRWEDIGGYEEVKRRIREVVELPLLRPGAFATMKLSPPRGIILHGPPGRARRCSPRRLPMNAGRTSSSSAAPSC